VNAAFGRFLELSLATADIAASVAFYEQLGFGQFPTGDAWPYRYGVVGDGRIHLGLHECALPCPAVSFVLPGLARAQASLVALGLTIERTHFGDAELHWLRLRDPGGHALMLLEARTFSPSPLAPVAESRCGYFQHLSLPQSDLQAARVFWEQAGLITLPPEEAPYPHLPLVSDPLNLALHRVALFPAPLLVFACAALPAARTSLLERGVTLSEERPGGLAARAALLLRAPEGTALLLVQAE
jgi:catechol 2,3-dioxygenase-like lactoylglutathione lyase family enzyme